MKRGINNYYAEVIVFSFTFFCVEFEYEERSVPYRRDFATFWTLKSFHHRVSHERHLIYNHLVYCPEFCERF